ncbi:hypothetical protein VTK73DRAFT_6035 [Phialemonium thermophilum]|uniref:Mmc1 C-terminal domain-containing protein n=1 Tax=Phialemonium thermophilum TaxID=223376 RepID=A0ABR3XX39_9PEZI
MPVRLSFNPIAGSTRGLSASRLSRLPPAVCLFCSLSFRAPASLSKARLRAAVTTPSRRAESSLVSPAVVSDPSDGRDDLISALADLKKYAANYVNLSRVELALRNLAQPTGQESIRIAILGLSNITDGWRTARHVLRLLLADPLKPEESWEKELERHDASRPLIVRVTEAQPDMGVAVAYARDSLVAEMTVSSPPLNGNNLELLLMEVNPFDSASSREDILGFEDAVLVPTVDIPTSDTGRYNPVTTPVHKALLVGDGIMGAASVVNLPLLVDQDLISAAVNIRQYASEDLSAYPFNKIDTAAAIEGLQLFRDSVGNARQYEALWSDSNILAVSTWLKAGVLSNGTGATKQAVRGLIQSLLRNTAAAIQAEEASKLSSTLSSKFSATSAASLDQCLTRWAQSAHEELQEQLDDAFTGPRWRNLRWWKLFWRVDDVSMLSAEMIAQRFLPEAERGVIYLAGRMEEAGITKSNQGADRPSYPGPVLAPLPHEGAGSPLRRPTPELEGRWPTHIPFTRNYLVDKAVPALQALAQRLVVQSLTTSAMTTALAALAYLSSFGAYEAGAIAALGFVWSMRRLQTKWETARSYWEGEVREEGRKAVRATEASVAEVLERSKKVHTVEDEEALVELTRIRELIDRAEDALARLK